MNCQAPNRYILAISGLMFVFAISIGVAIIFPYQDDVGDDNDNAESSSATFIYVDQPQAQAQTAALAEDFSDDGTALKGDGSVVTDPVVGNKAGSSGARNDEGIDIASMADETGQKKEETVEITASEVELKDDTKNEETSTETAFEEDELSKGKNDEGLFDHTSKETHTTEEDTTCPALLLQADVNSNQMIDTTEYLSFLHSLQSSNRLHAGKLPENYSELDFPLRINFLQQSCICPFDMPDCCDERNGIYIGSDEIADSVCSFTMNVGEDGNIGRSDGENAKGLRGATR